MILVFLFYAPLTSGCDWHFSQRNYYST